MVVCRQPSRTVVVAAGVEHHRPLGYFTFIGYDSKTLYFASDPSVRIARGSADIPQIQSAHIRNLEKLVEAGKPGRP